MIIIICHYLCTMVTDNRITPRELWARQRINDSDVDYVYWNKKRKSLIAMAQMSHSCIFTVDVFKERYDFASANFVSLFGYDPDWIRTIRKQGDMLEDRIHCDDREELARYQVEHGQFIYSLPIEQRNDYQQIFQFRMLNAKQVYMNVVSRHQVIEKDRNGKAWIVMGVMDISPDQSYRGSVKRVVLNKKTGELLKSPVVLHEECCLTEREKEILLLIRQGLLSKEIASTLNISICTVNNHRKNILTKLGVSNSIEAVNRADNLGILDGFMVNKPDMNAFLI